MYRIFFNGLPQKNHFSFRKLWKPALLSFSYCTESFRLSVGKKADLTKRFSKKDIEIFASISGDTNPIHLDDNYAAATRFKKCVVHGVLINGLVSAIVGTNLPGEGSIVLSQYVEFPAPLYVDEAVSAVVEVKDIKKRLVTVTATCSAPDSGKVVLKGEVRLLVPRRMLPPNV